MKKDIKAWIKALTPKNITTTATKIAKQLWVEVQKVKTLLNWYVKKYWPRIKDYLADIFDDLADKLRIRSKLLWWEWALKAPVTNLQRAKNMTKAWFSADDIWKKTGWEKWTDWKWRFEIDDSKAKILLDKKSFLNNAIKKINNGENPNLYRLDDILEHEELYKKYPLLRDTIVDFDLKELKLLWAKAGNINGKLVMDPQKLWQADFRSSLIHEIQHSIQKTEWFATWWNLNVWLKNYKRLAWETEARNVQTRLIKPSKNKLIRPEKTEDVLRSKQIIKKDWWTVFNIWKVNNLDDKKIINWFPERTADEKLALFKEWIKIWKYNDLIDKVYDIPNKKFANTLKKWVISDKYKTIKKPTWISKPNWISKVDDLVKIENKIKELKAKWDTKWLPTLYKQLNELKAKKPTKLDPDIATSLRKAKWLSAEDIMKKYPDIELKRDVVAKDIHWNKKIIPEWEALTPYELKGNKVLLQDWQTYIVNKNQYQNIKQNAIVWEWAPFMNEFKGVKETVRWKWNPNTYEQYTLPWGENYREILIQSPKKEKWILKLEADLKNYMNKLREKYWPDKDLITYSTDKEYDVIKKIKSDIEKLKWKIFKSSHYDEENILATLRVKDRTYKKPNDTYFAEEFQSDWAIGARKNGFAFEWDAEKLLPKWWKVEYNWVNYIVKDVSWETALNKFPNASWWAWAWNKEQAIAMALWRNDLMPWRWVPFNPLVKDWKTLSVKRGLSEAVEQNKKYFSWTTWAQQKARYNLSKQVNEIGWTWTHDGKIVEIQAKWWKNIDVVINKEWKVKTTYPYMPQWFGKDIDDVVWKWIAGKILKSNDWQLKWLKLDIGWEWAYNLYDKEIVKLVENLTWGKVKYVDMGMNVHWKVPKYTLASGTDAWGRLWISDLKKWTRFTDEYKKVWEITSVQDKWKFEAVPVKKLKEEYWEADSFNIWKKNELQPILELTPKIVRKIKWLAPIIKKPSWLTPFLK